MTRSEEHTSELQSHLNLVCRLLLEKKHTLLLARRDSTSVGSLGVGVTRRCACAARDTACRCAARTCARCACWVFCFFFLKYRAPPEFSPFPLHAALRI